MTELTLTATHQGGMKVLAEARGLAIPTDYPLPGHPAEAPTSLELLLAALCTCVANGVALLLRKAGCPAERLEVSAVGQRRETHPTVLESIELKVLARGEGLTGDVLNAAIGNAEALCPVWAMLKPGTAIAVTGQVIP